MLKARMSIYVIFMFILISVLTGCNEPQSDPLLDALFNSGYDHKQISGELFIYNKTGHNIYINGNFVANNGYIRFSHVRDRLYASESVQVEAFMEEYDSAGNVTWGYYNNDSHSYGIGKSEFSFTDTSYNNEYKASDVNNYPVILKRMTVTNKTGYQVEVGETNKEYETFLNLSIDGVGVINRSQLVTTEKSLYFFVYNNNSYGPPLRITLSKNFIRNNNAFDIPAELLAKGVIYY